VYPDGYHGCGGSLISSNIVLSAAHCTPDITHVQIGRYDHSDINDEFETFSILHTLVYPLYDENSFLYDQMLVVMDGESKAAPIRINRSPTVPANGARVITMGWGVTNEGADYVSPVLMEASIFVESNSKCSLSYSHIDADSVLITPDMLCATDEGKDSCQGDSGGPLILAESNKSDLLVGVTSWGYGCADPDFPGIYSRTSFDPDWIDFNVCLYSNNTAPSDFLCDNSTMTHDDEPFLTLEIMFDEYPEEVGWALMSSGVASESRTDNTIASRTPPYYGYALANELVTEIIFIPAASASYTFIVIDSNGDGLCCVYGNGSYRLWKGPVEDNELLASGDASGSFPEETAFALAFAPTASSTATPTASSTALTLLSLKCAVGLVAATIGCLLYNYC
jgi:trypsin